MLFVPTICRVNRTKECLNGRLVTLDTNSNINWLQHFISSADSNWINQMNRYRFFIRNHISIGSSIAFDSINRKHSNREYRNGITATLNWNTSFAEFSVRFSLKVVSQRSLFYETMLFFSAILFIGIDCIEFGEQVRRSIRVNEY